MRNFAHTLRLTLLLGLMLLGGCSDHPLAGYWRQHGAEEGHGLALQFEPGGNGLQVHVDDPDRGHYHLDGTYSRGEAGVIEVVWTADDGTEKRLAGKLEGDKLSLQGAGGPLVFERTAGDGHGH